MSRILKQEVKQQILDDNILAADFCNHMGVKIISLDQMIRRDNRRLTHVDNISWLAKRIKLKPDEMLTESDNKVTA